MLRNWLFMEKTICWRLALSERSFQRFRAKISEGEMKNLKVLLPDEAFLYRAPTTL